MMLGKRAAQQPLAHMLVPKATHAITLLIKELLPLQRSPVLDLNRVKMLPKMAANLPLGKKVVLNSSHVMRLEGTMAMLPLDTRAVLDPNRVLISARRVKRSLANKVVHKASHVKKLARITVMLPLEKRVVLNPDRVLISARRVRQSLAMEVVLETNHANRPEMKVILQLGITAVLEAGPVKISTRLLLLLETTVALVTSVANAWMMETLFPITLVLNQASVAAVLRERGITSPR
mmetsp:Transcript_33519/g.81197  ORF Transcript_33519/g.81197 Transcript_33519/m.81197 type:complete len:235 (-) Transcript_33519:977-1681(-)